MLMIIAIVAVPIMAYSSMGSMDLVVQTMSEQGLSTSLFTSGVTVVGVISTMAWGLGYFGQPHILARFMGIKSIKEIPKARGIAIVWVIIALLGAIMVGVLSIPLFPGLTDGAQETVFMLMIRKFFPPWIGGIFLAAIMAAIMSTIDSQLLVCSSALTEDIYTVFFKKAPTEKQVVLFGRLAVVGIALIALFLALAPNNTVMGLVSYSWAGFGAAFGPLVIFALYSKNTSWQAALSGMIVGTLTVIIWKNVGLGSVMYEIVPGFILNMIVMLIVNRLTKPDIQIENEFDSVVEATKKVTA
jgi:sodium/proline symporter